MDLVIDTHVFLWWNAAPEKLNPQTRDALADPDNAIYVSAASVWEIAIKQSLGKLAFSGSAAEAIAACGFSELPISARDAERAGGLDWPHRDPFDRMLTAQCLNHKCTLVTADAVLLASGRCAVMLAG